jgi:hypothetical protein
MVGEERLPPPGPPAGPRITWLDVGGGVAVEPVHAVPPADQPLELTKGGFGGITELGVELGGPQVVVL